MEELLERGVVALQLATYELNQAQQLDVEKQQEEEGSKALGKAENEQRVLEEKNQRKREEKGKQIKQERLEEQNTPVPSDEDKEGEMEGKDKAKSNVEEKRQQQQNVKNNTTPLIIDGTKETKGDKEKGSDENVNSDEENAQQKEEEDKNKKEKRKCRIIIGGSCAAGVVIIAIIAVVFIYLSFIVNAAGRQGFQSSYRLEARCSQSYWFKEAVNRRRRRYLVTLVHHTLEARGVASILHVLEYVSGVGEAVFVGVILCWNDSLIGPVMRWGCEGKTTL